MTHKPLEFWHKDATGACAPTKMVGKKFFHPKTRHIYVVKAVTFDAERALWMVRYEQDYAYSTDEMKPDTDFVHSLADFSREGRFVEICK